MRLSHFVYSLLLISFCYLLTVANSGCGQIGMPTGGPKDSIPPRLLSASPQLNSVNVTTNKITLTFDEYVDLKDAQTNVLVSPFPKKTPVVDFRLKTVTVKLKDSLLPNTTYSINFGSAIVDNNEGNPFKDFTYVFSTGNQIDSFILSGKVVLAENGKTDSTLIAMLYRSTEDSAVQKNKPDYISKLNRDGSFTFVNLPAGNFKVYALKDGDGGKTYNSKKELFAFADSPVTVSENTEPVILLASAFEKEKLQTVKSAGPAKKLIYTLAPGSQIQDLLKPFVISFNNPLKKFDPAKLILRDTNYTPIPSVSWVIDSNQTKISAAVKWQEGMEYRLIMDTTAVTDSADNYISKLDTIRFTSKKLTDYGKVVLRFTNLDLTKHPVLQFVLGEEIKNSYPLSAMEWSNNFVEPGEYDIRILFDKNKNGIWEPGDYSKKLQPEMAITLLQKIAVRANWDNERDIKF